LKMLKLVLSVVAAVCAFPGISHATNEWNVNAASCVADAASIRGNLYIGTGGTIKFAPGKVGDIVLYCPVSFNLGFTPSIVGLTYYDDTSAAGNHVTVQLIKMEMEMGTITSIVTADSNSGALSKNGKGSGVVHEFTDKYDPVNCAYYLRIDIIRNSPTANETAFGVALQD
jgi:hypothetical protein